MKYSVETNAIQIVTLGNQFSISDDYNGETKTVFAGDLRKKQHARFLANVRRTLVSMKKAA